MSDRLHVPRRWTIRLCDNCGRPDNGGRCLEDRDSIHIFACARFVEVVPAPTEGAVDPSEVRDPIWQQWLHERDEALARVEQLEAAIKDARATLKEAHDSEQYWIERVEQLEAALRRIAAVYHDDDLSNAAAQDKTYGIAEEAINARD